MKGKSAACLPTSGQMIALVDYDNIHGVYKRRGLGYIVERLAAAIGFASLAPAPRLQVRLYGGWFKGRMTSRGAQALAPEVAGTFPRAIPVVEGANKTNVIVDASFAYGVLAHPGVSLTHTFRVRGFPEGLACAPAPFVDCAAPAQCLLAGLPAFVNSQVCSHAMCAVSALSVLSRSEQKLVDTMITADLVHLAAIGEPQVAVVSTDDDMWPGIVTALSKGTQIVHVHPKPGRRTPPGKLPYPADH